MKIYQIKYKIKTLLWKHRHWRSTAYTRGYYAAMKDRPLHDAREEAFMAYRVVVWQIDHSVQSTGLQEGGL